MIYLANSFSLNMIEPPAILRVDEVGRDEFCNVAKIANNALGHESTVQLVNTLCGTQLSVNRVAIKAQDSDEIYVVQLMTRLPEGKVLNLNEILELYNQGKIKFYKVTVKY